MTFGRPIIARPLVPVGIATIGPRAAMAYVLAEYLRTATFRVWSDDGSDVDFQLAEVVSEWPDPGSPLNYPAASIVEMTDTFYEGHNMTPTPLEDTLGVYDGECGNGPNDPKTVLWKHAEASVQFQVDFWASNKPQREAIEAELSALFSPGEERYGVLLGGHPRYFDRSVRATLEGHRRMDMPSAIYANERRLQCAIRCEIDIVRLYRAVLTSLSVRTEAEDPNDPTSEEP